MKFFRNILSSKKFGRTNLKNWQIATIDFVVDIVIILILVLGIIRPFLFAPFQVQQESMMPNILDGEYILVWKFPYNHIFGWKNYERNDVVVFRPRTNSDTYLIKRVVGLPGETVRLHEGSVWVRSAEDEKFQKLDESFLSEKNVSNTCLTAACSDSDKSRIEEFTVLEDSYFVLGDNRTHSRDSRSCFVSSCADPKDRFLSEAEIEGRVFLVVARIWQEGGSKHFSFRSMRLLKDPTVVTATEIKNEE
jgi:signal peptidase I